MNLALMQEEIEAWRPPEDLTVSECADKYRVLGRGSSKPGQWETSFVPFLQDIMDAFAMDAVEEIWFVLAGGGRIWRRQRR